MLLRPSPSRFFFIVRLGLFSRFLVGIFLLYAVQSHAQTSLISLLQQVNHVAGTAVTGYSGDGAPAASAAVNAPMGVAFDGGGNLYIADTGNNRIRRVDAVTGIMTTVVGNGQQGYAGDGGAAANAQLNLPAGIAVDATGNLFIADTGNSAVRKVNAQTGVITTVAGNGTAGYQGDLGLATAAELNHPSAISLDNAGNMFIADSANNRVRRVDAVTGIISRYAGTGLTTYNGDGMLATSAALNNPQGLAVDAAGDLYLTDTGHNLVREVVAATGNIQIVAGTAGQPGGFGGDGGLATSALLNAPTGIAQDATGNLYISDTANARIRKIAAGTITTYAGTGTAGFNNTDGVLATAAQVNQPDGLAIDSIGEVDVADTTNNAVRAISDGRHFPAVMLSSTQPVSRNIYLQVNSALTISSIVVSAGEKQKSEFAASSRTVTAGTLTNCATNTSFAAGFQCIVPLTFAPIYPGQRDASLSITANVGTADIGLFGIGMGPETVLSPGIITSILPSQAPPTMGTPEQLAIDPQGNVYVADKLDKQILVWYAGNPSTSQVFVGASAGAVVPYATLNAPTAVALDAAGNLYIADSGANDVLRVDAATHAVTAVAGTSTILSTPSGIAATPDGTLYIADTGNNVVRRVDSQTGIITTVAGDGTAGPSGGGQATLATLNAPISVALDDHGNLYIADTGNNVIRMVNPVTGIITTVAGNGNPDFTGDSGLATQASLNKPLAIAVDAADNLYIADAGNARIRRVDAASGQIETIAGSNLQGDSGDGGGATLATLEAPSGVGVDALGQVVLADQTAGSVRSITAIPPAGLNFGTTVTGCGSTPPQTVELANIGNQSLAVADLSAPIDFPLIAANADNCVANVSQAAGSVCSMTFAFEPIGPGLWQEDASLTDNTQYIAPDSIQLIAMTGTGQPLNVIGTTTTVTAVPTSSAYGAPLVLTATVMTTQTPTAPVATGTVQFSINGVEVGAAPLNGVGVATITIPAAPIGTALIVASHPQQCNYGPSAAQTSIAVFQAATQTVLTASATNVPYGQPVTLEAIVTPVTSGVPTGLVDFMDGTAQIGQATLDGTGHATLVLNQKALPLGANTFTAQYLGDPDYLPSNSNSVVVTVYDAKLTMTVTPTLVQLAAGKSTQLHVTLTPLNGFDQTVYLSCAGLSAGAECIFSPATVPFNTLTTTQQVTLTIQSNILVTAGVRPATSGKLLFGWLLMFFTLLAASILQRTRRTAAVAMYRWVLIAIMGIGLATGFGTLTGCGSTAPLPGIYTTVMVQASTPSSGVLVSIPFQLDMGQ